MRGLAGVLMCAGVSDVCVCHVCKCVSVRKGVGVRMLSLACVHVGVGMCGHVYAYVRVCVRAVMVGPESMCRRGRVPGSAARVWHGCAHDCVVKCVCICVWLCVRACACVCRWVGVRTCVGVSNMCVSLVHECV